MGKRESINIIKKFIKNLNKDFHVKNVIFFGSRAEGRTKRNSDIDLIIVSNEFKGMDFFERVSSMYDYWDADIPVDFLCYTEEEFNKLKKLVSIVSSALKKGIIISS